MKKNKEKKMATKYYLVTNYEGSMSIDLQRKCFKYGSAYITEEAQSPSNVYLFPMELKKELVVEGFLLDDDSKNDIIDDEQKMPFQVVWMDDKLKFIAFDVWRQDELSDKEKLTAEEQVELAQIKDRLTPLVLDEYYHQMDKFYDKLL